MGDPDIHGQRVAFFGGSFDPPHLGHLAIARAAQQTLRLDTVLFVPVGAQPLKPEGASASFADRVAMTRLAIAGDPAFSVSTIDAPTASSHPNYTLETLTRLQVELGPQVELFFLMGADSFFSLRRWHRASEIPFAATLIVASRPGEPLDNLKAGLPAALTIEPVPAAHASAREAKPGAVELAAFLLHNPSGATASFYLLPGLHVEISATAIRESILALTAHHTQPGADSAASVSSCLPQSVLAYIDAHGLYANLPQP
jgi:nicotinate-nucleotide adenylyltransferase